MVRRTRDGTTWRIGTDAEVAWIVNGASPGQPITAALPPIFEAYATVVLPYSDEQETRRRGDLGSFWPGVLPNLIFPVDHSWLGIGAVGRRLELHRRTGEARNQIPAPARPASQAGSAWPRRHATRS